jgi:hypothetical protein
MQESVIILVVACASVLIVKENLHVLSSLHVRFFFY